MVDTRNITFAALVGLAMYLGYRTLSGVGSTVTQPFEFAGGLIDSAAGGVGTVFSGIQRPFEAVETVGEDLYGGITSGVDTVTDVPGDAYSGFTSTADDVFSGVTSAPGNIAGGTSDVFDSVGDTADTLNPFS